MRTTGSFTSMAVAVRSRRERFCSAAGPSIAHGSPQYSRRYRLSTVTGEYLIRALDEDRLSDRPLFPPELKGVTW